MKEKVSFASCFVALSVNFIDRTDTRFARLDGFQVLDQIVLLLLGQAQFEDTIVMVDDVGQSRESAVMVEATFMDLLRIEKRAQRFCPVTIIGRSLRLEIINADLLWSMSIFGERTWRSAHEKEP